jgi:hypothetical protein
VLVVVVLAADVSRSPKSPLVRVVRKRRVAVAMLGVVASLAADSVAIASLIAYLRSQSQGTGLWLRSSTWLNC